MPISPRHLALFAAATLFAGGVSSALANDEDRPSDDYIDIPELRANDGGGKDEGSEEAGSTPVSAAHGPLQGSTNPLDLLNGTPGLGNADDFDLFGPGAEFSNSLADDMDEIVRAPLPGDIPSEGSEAAFFVNEGGSTGATSIPSPAGAALLTLGLAHAAGRRRRR